MKTEAPPTFRLPPAVASLLARVRRRLRWISASRGAAWTAGASGLLFALALAADRFFFLDPTVRHALPLAFSIIVGAFLIRGVLYPLLRPLPRVRLAQLIEERTGEFGGSLRSVVEFDEEARGRRRTLGTGSPELLGRLCASTARVAETIEAPRCVPSRGRRGALLFALLGLLPLLAWLGVDREGFMMLARRFVDPAAPIPRPSTVAIEVSPGSRRVLRGDSVEVVVRATRGEPRTAEIRVTRPADRGEAWTVIALERRTADTFAATLESIDERVLYKVRAGDAESPTFTLDPADPPHALAYHVRYRYPEYMRTPDRTVEQARGTIEGVRGTRADVVIDADAPLSGGHLERGGGERIDGRVEGSRLRFDGLEIEQSAHYRLFLVGESGLESPRGEPFIVRAVEDARPVVTLLEPSTDEITVEERSRVELVVRAEDDIGLRSVEIFVHPEGEQPRSDHVVATVLDESVSANGAGPGPRFVEEEAFFSVEDLALESAKRARVSLRARDALGQETIVAGASIRVVWVPGTPEGEKWRSQLSALHAELTLLREDLRRASPSVTGEGASVDAAAVRDSASTLAVRAETLSERAFELASTSRAGGPERRMLEHTARILLRLSISEAVDLWVGGAPAVAAARRGSERLESLESAFSTYELLESLESLADLVRELERSISASDPASLARPHPPTDRTARWQAESARIDREIESMVSRFPRRASLIYWMRAYRSSVHDALAALPPDDSSPPLETRARIALALSRRAELLDEEIGRIGREWERARGRIASAPEASEELDHVARLLARIATAANVEERDAAAVRSGLGSIEAELELAIAVSRSYGFEDVESVQALAASRDLVAELRKDVERALLGAERDQAEVTEISQRADRFAQAFRATLPFRRAGRRIQDIERVAAAVDETGRHIASAKVWNVRLLRLAARATRGNARTLADVETALVAHEGVRGAEEAEKTVRSARESIEESARLLTGGPAGVGERSLAGADRANRDASLALDDARAALLEVRRSLLDAAAQELRFLLDARGSLLERLEALVEGQSRIADEIAPLRSEEGDPSSLASREDELRTNASRLGTDLADPLPPSAGADHDVLRESVQPGDLEEAGRALLRVRDDAMLAAARSLAHAAELSGDERHAELDRAVEASTRASGELRAIADSLRVLATEALAALVERERAGDLERADDRAGLSLEEIATLAERLLVACKTARSELEGALPPGAGKESLLQELALAANAFGAALERARARDEGGASQKLDEGVERFRDAIELARALRGDASATLASTASPEGGGRGSERDDEAMDEIRKEIEDLLAERAALAEIERLLAELLGKESGTISKEEIEALARAQEELARELESKHLEEDELLELVAELLRVERSSKAMAEEQRYLEEEARRRAALERPFLAPELEVEEARAEAARGAVSRLAAAGSKLTVIVPPLYEGFRRARIAGSRWIEALAELPAALGTSPPDPEPVARANLELGVFLRQVESTRELALDVLAARRNPSGSLAGDEAMGRAAQALREAARLARAGRLSDASGRTSTATQAIAGTTSALQRRLAGLKLAGSGVGTSGLDGGDPLLSPWRAEAREDEIEATSERAVERWERMSYPERYRAIVEPYLRLFERR